MEVNLNDVVHISETSLTIRGSRRRTTVPVEVVDYLGLSDGDKVRWILMKDGTITITPVKKLKPIGKQRKR